MHSPLALVRDPSAVADSVIRPAADPAAHHAAGSVAAAAVAVAAGAADTDGAPRSPEAFDALEHLVGVNLARLRAERQLSLDALARASGVSRAMLAQIESARSVPSIKVLCKVAAALRVSVAAFLRRHATNGFEHLPAERSARVVSSNGRYSARPLYPDDEAVAAEFHELRIAPLHTEAGVRRAPGTIVNLVVSDGTLEVSVQDRRQLLATGDAIVFDADQPHSLRNPGDTEARAFRVTLRAETPPRWEVPAVAARDDAAREGALG
ncbi:XRE family transcriptional regulator [Paraburkholderia sp. MMS20-SJTR3]|uniref:XRE family transcriptional regulator n=1 Tax=Paraburkholderia sejongensis TaxID=2886946 RepID=A0ABS8JVX3_9BURK|nr:XRE family transcriptional regulator [Paraburkholderia sp. MMS20-SJTR3]MCC8394034.1 XRE family transcriptional regulator [Paraburkholderia sp. MMS20-SJTR3]